MDIYEEFYYFVKSAVMKSTSHQELSRLVTAKTIEVNERIERIGLCPECGKLGGSHLWSCKTGERALDASNSCPKCGELMAYHSLTCPNAPGTSFGIRLQKEGFNAE